MGLGLAGSFEKLKTAVVHPLTYYRQKRLSQKFVARQETAKSAIGKLDKDLGFTILTNGSFSMIDAISCVLDQTGPSKLVISTWVPGMQEISDLADLKKSKRVLGLKLIVDYGFCRSKMDQAIFVEKAIGRENIVETRTHAKIACIRNSDWDFCLRGSLNLNGNFRCENLDGDDDKGLCDAIEGWFDDLLRLNGPGLFKPGSAVYKAYLQAINNGMPRGISMGRNLRLQK